MDRFGYADNVYNFDNPFGNASHTMLAIQALRARQQQEAIQNQFEARRLNMAEQLQVPQMEQMRAQSAQARAAIGHQNALVAEMQRQLQASKQVQDIGAAIAGARNFTNADTLGTLVQANRAVPGLMQQGGFDVALPPAADTLGPSPADVGVSGFPGLPQAPDYTDFLSRLVNTGQGGIEAIMRGTVAGSPGASADLLKLPVNEFGGYNQFGNQVVGQPPMSAYQRGHIEQLQRTAEADRLMKERDLRMQNVARIVYGMKPGQFEEPEDFDKRREQALQTFESEADKLTAPKQSMEGTTPPYKFSIDQATKDAMDLILRRPDLEARVRAEFKAKTGKDLDSVMPQDFDIPRPRTAVR